MNERGPPCNAPKWLKWRKPPVPQDVLAKCKYCSYLSHLKSLYGWSHSIIFKETSQFTLFNFILQRNETISPSHLYRRNKTAAEWSSSSSRDVSVSGYWKNLEWKYEKVFGCIYIRKESCWHSWETVANYWEKGEFFSSEGQCTAVLCKAFLQGPRFWRIPRVTSGSVAWPQDSEPGHGSDAAEFVLVQRACLLCCLRGSFGDDLFWKLGALFECPA